MYLATIGYEGLYPQDFFNLLQKAGVETIVDIRELPISRKRGFSKKALLSEAPFHGLTYKHIGELGSPSELRHSYQNNGDWTTFSNGYHQHLSLQINAVEELCTLIKKSYCCLLCFESNHLNCHRSILANRLRIELGDDLTIFHLVPVSKVDIAWLQPAADKSILQSTIDPENAAYFPLGILNLSD